MVCVVAKSFVWYVLNNCYCVVVTGSCRPVLRFIVRRHMYETLLGEFDVLCFTCISTTLMIFSYHGLCRDELRMQTHGLTIESYIVDVSSSRVRRPICASSVHFISVTACMFH